MDWLYCCESKATDVFWHTFYCVPEQSGVDCSDLAHDIRRKLVDTMINESLLCRLLPRADQIIINDKPVLACRDSGENNAWQSFRPISHTWPGAFKLGSQPVKANSLFLRGR